MEKVHMLVSEKVGMLGYRECLCCFTPKNNYTKDIEFVTCKMCLEEHKKIKESKKNEQLTLFKE